MNAVTEDFINQLGTWVTGASNILFYYNYNFPAVGVPDVPVIKLENGSIIVWTPPTNNGRNITRYVVTVDSTE